MSQSPFPGPIAPQNNPPINPQYYQPRIYYITAISEGPTTIITTSTNHDYVIGQEVRLVIPPSYGAQTLNQQTGYVIAIPAANQVVTTINSLGVNPFNPTPSYGPTQPQIVAIGDVNSGPINATGRSNTGTFIEGSFINISPI